MQLLPKWNVDLRPVWRKLCDEVVILAILFRTPFYLAAAVGAASASFAWVLVLTQFAVNVLAKYRRSFRTSKAKADADGAELTSPQFQKRVRKSNTKGASGHAHKTRKPSYVRVPGMADPTGDSGESMANDASDLASLRVTVMGAHDLVVKGRGSTDPSPFCKLFLIAGGEKSKKEFVTAKCRHTKMPSWTEDKEQKVFEQINIKDTTLIVQMWDHHTMWKDKIIGEIAIPATQIRFGCNEAQFELRPESTAGTAGAISLGMMTVRTRLFLVDEDYAQIQEQTKKLQAGLRVQKRNEHESVFGQDPDPEAEDPTAGKAATGDFGERDAQESESAREEKKSTSRLFAARLQRIALQITDLYIHAIGGLAVAFLFGLYKVDVFLLAVMIEVLIVLERRLPSLHEAIEEDDEEFGHPRLSRQVSQDRVGKDADSDSPYQPFLAELFSKMRGDAAKGRIDVSAEWLTGALATAWELYTPWADKFVGKLLKEPLDGLGLDLDYFTVGQVPLVCKSVKGVPHTTRPGNYYDLELQLEWTAELYIQIGWKGIPLVVVEGLYLSAGLQACMKMLELNSDDAPTIFPNIDGMRLCLERRPELDLQLKLFGVFDLLSVMLLAYLKEVALDYVYENLRNLWYFNTESQREEQLQWIKDYREGNTLLGPFGERFIDSELGPPRPMAARVFKGRRYLLVVNCVLGCELSEQGRTFCVLRYGRATSRFKKAKGPDDRDLVVDMVEKQTRPHGEHKGDGYTLWQEQFCWLTRDARDLLEVEVFDHNNIKEHSSIGRWKEEFGSLCRAMNLIPDAPPTFKPIDMGKGKGKIHLTVQLQTLWDDPPPAAALEPGAAKKAGRKTATLLKESVWDLQTGLLLVNLIKADSLPSTSASGKVRKSLTVKLFLVDKKQIGNPADLEDEWLSKESWPCFNTLSPRWSNLTTENVFWLEVDRQASSTLLVAQVCGVGDDMIGYQVYRLADLERQEGSRVFSSRSQDVKKQLLDSSGAPVAGDRLSTLHLDLEFTPDPIEADPLRPRELHGVAATLPGPYLKVEIRKCHNLKKMDLIGKSDPFAEVEVSDEPNTGDELADAIGRLRGCTRKRTYTIDNTLEPVWTNQVFYFHVNRLHEQKITVTVKDEDRLGPSTPIGQWACSLRQIFFLGGELPLQPLEDAGQSGAGMLDISVKFLGDWSHLSNGSNAPSVAASGARRA